MTDVTAFLSPQESAGGVWRLWVDTTLLKGAGGVQHDFPAGPTAPTVAARIRALAALGFVPADPTPGLVWRWRELPSFSGEGVTVVGETLVRPLPEATGTPAVSGRRRTTAEVRNAPRGGRGPVAPEELAELLGPEAAQWPALGLTVHRGGVIDYDGSQFRVLDGHELVGFTMAQGEGRQYRAVVHTDREGLPYGEPLPALPDDPLRARHEALQGFLPPADPDYPQGPYVPRVARGVVGDGPGSV
ncbi:DUF6303 family protein [Streptomyces sp. NPDC006175]|uniref:DUF6303 family protein n=1 Tax=Streptomyces sp. NPDC006175 TaxID=3154471 RepID=UPI0033B5CC14